MSSLLHRKHKEPELNRKIKGLNLDGGTLANLRNYVHKQEIYQGYLNKQKDTKHCNTKCFHRISIKKKTVLNDLLKYSDKIKSENLEGIAEEIIEYDKNQVKNHKRKLKF